MNKNFFLFKKNGIQTCGKIYSKIKCKSLLKKIKKNRNFKNIFLTKKKFINEKQNLSGGTNPRPGHNLLHKLNCDFIFTNKKFRDEMKKTLGKNYRILDYKLVMGVPDSIIPKWIKEITRNNHTINLGRFIKPKFRDITYFRGIDFHQDIIDYPTRAPDFVTVYIYLENVNKNTSPLYLIPNSHKLGATIYPHNLIINKKNNNVLYKNKNKKIKSKIFMLKGNSGFMSYWHPFILHGTQPHKFSQPRISIRILAEKNRYVDVNSDLDKLNRKIFGKKRIKLTQNEFNKKGKILRSSNIINKLQ